MLRHLKSLFLRFKAQHFEFSVPGFQLRSKTGDLIGNVDRVTVQDRRINFQGWCHAEQVSVVTNGGGTATATPSELRSDVSNVFGGSANVGFHLAEAFGNGRYTLSVSRKEKDFAPLHIRPVRRLRWFGAMARLGLKFCARLMIALPSAWAWRMRKDLAARARVKTLMGLVGAPECPAIDPSELPRDQARDLPTSAEKLTIVLPIFNAFHVLQEALRRVALHTDVPWHLVLIEDCSTDPPVRPWLRNWVQNQRQMGHEVDLLENDKNLGFIASVNLGLEEAISLGSHVVLLNSDALVPKGWATRLLAPILADKTVASATPMSNDAEIFSVPSICNRVDLAAGQADQIDKVAARVPLGREYPDVPTGVGFCMAININFLRKLPHFDTVFGKGYGEEVDWCQTVCKLGGRHVAVPNLFVEHRGGASFGSAEKQALIAKNNNFVAERYPTYDLDVQRFVHSDPLITPRMVLGIAWATQQAAGKAVPIYLAHSLGGGADMYIESIVARDWERFGLPSVVLRVGGSQRWQVELVLGKQRCRGTLQETSDVRRLLSLIERRKIIYSCGVGDSDPMRLPQEILSLKTSETDQIDILVHDYFMVSPTYTLLNEKGVYQSPSQAANSSFGNRVSDRKWRASWGALIDEADRIRVFSQSSRDIIVGAYPSARWKIALKPHDLLFDVPKVPEPEINDDRKTVAVLGNIGFHKGAEVVCELGHLLERRNDFALIVIGKFDPVFELPSNVKVHGGYLIEDLANLTDQYQVTDWLIPSIWPETFSYTTHEALATGLPTHAFDIGAQRDAVAAAPNGRAIDYSGGQNLAQNALRSILSAGDTREKLATAVGL